MRLQQKDCAQNITTRIFINSSRKRLRRGPRIVHEELRERFVTSTSDTFHSSTLSLVIRKKSRWKRTKVRSSKAQMKSLLSWAPSCKFLFTLLYNLIFTLISLTLIYPYLPLFTFILPLFYLYSTVIEPYFPLSEPLFYPISNPCVTHRITVYP